MPHFRSPRIERLESRRCCTAIHGPVQTLASAGNVGEYTSIAINPVTHEPAIAYYDVTHHDLRFLQYDGSRWQGSTIDAPGNVGLYASLKFDQTGRAWVAYFDATDRDLRIAVNHKTGWQIRTVDSTAAQGYYASLAMTSAGDPVIAYYGNTTARGAGLKLATRTAAGWTIQTVDASADAQFGAPGAFCSLALDGHNRARISYQSADLDLDYAAFDGDAWHIQTVEAVALGESGYDTHLVLDSAGHPHISYTYPFTMGGGDGGTFYAENLGNSWSITRVDKTIEGEGFDDSDATSLLLDADGNAIITYRTVGASADSPTDNQLVIASSTNDGFTDVAVDTSHQVGGYLSTTLDADDRILVAYYDQSTGDLRLFTGSI